MQPSWRHRKNNYWGGTECLWRSLIDGGRETHRHGDTLHVYERGCRVNDLDGPDVCLPVEAACLHAEMWLRGARAHTRTRTLTHGHTLFFNLHDSNAWHLFSHTIINLTMNHLVGLLEYSSHYSHTLDVYQHFPWFICRKLLKLLCLYLSPYIICSCRSLNVCFCVIVVLLSCFWLLTFKRRAKSTNIWTFVWFHAVKPVMMMIKHEFNQ